MLGLLFLAGTIVLLFAARAYGRLAADKSFDQLLAGSALSIAETLSIDRGALQVDLPYASLDMLSAAPDDRVLQVRVTSTPERFHAAADIAGVLLRNLQFPGEEPAEVTSPEESPASPE